MHWQRLVGWGLLCASLGWGQRLEPTEDFPFYEELEVDQRFQLFWRIDGDDIVIEVHAKTFGWVGIGISPDGFMVGSDIIVGGVRGDREQYATVGTLSVFYIKFSSLICFLYSVSHLL